MITTLDPYLIMRKDVNRVVVYPGKDHLFKRSFDFAYRFVDPRAAIVISLFNGQRSSEDVVAAWSELTDLDRENAASQVDTVLKEYADIMCESEQPPEFFEPTNPESVVCNSATVDYSARRLNVPTDMLYIPTLFCGHNCRYCYADIRKTRDDNELTLNELERIFDQAVDLQFASVSFSGGDPFLHPHIFDIIDMAFSRGYRFDIPTKSPLNEQQIQRLKDMGIDRLQISLDSPFDQEAVEFLTGRRNYFQPIMRTLQMLGEAGFAVGITCVVTAQTIDDVPRMAEYYADLGFIKRVSFAQVGCSIYRDFPELYPDAAKYEWLDKEINVVKSKYPHMFLKWDHLKDPNAMTLDERREWHKNRPSCSGGKYAFVLLPDGKVTLCEELYTHPAFTVGDLKKQTILEMWNSPEMLRIMQPRREDFVGSRCFDCDSFLECHTDRGRCWKRALMAFGNRDNAEHWPDPFCPLAPTPDKRMF